MRTSAPRLVEPWHVEAVDEVLRLRLPGRVALKHKRVVITPRPAFGHGVRHQLPNGQALIGCYHPSRQNTNTGKLTAAMMDDVFGLALRALGGAEEPSSGAGVQPVVSQ